MIRYINAGELLEDLKHVYCLSCKKVNTFYCWNTCDVSDIINDVLSYEPADVAPVVHAYNKSKDGFLCSACTFGDFGLFNHGGKYTPKYCPNCGAKMDEEVNDE